MSKSTQLLRIIISALLVTGCGGSTFSGGGGAASKSPGRKPSSNDNGTNNTTTNPSGDQTVNTDSSTQTAITPCPKTSQRILVIDLKSGWWAGDGARFFDKIMGGISSPCVGTVQFDYHHILDAEHESGVFPGGILRKNTSSNFDLMFQQKDWSQYTQIWLLSGSEHDPDDLKFNDPLLNRITDEIVKSKAPLFIGAGFGSVTHARKVASALLPNVVFGTSQQEGDILSPDQSGLPIKSVLRKGAQLNEHVLFSGVSKLVDEVFENSGGGGQIVKSDYLTSAGSLTIIGRNLANQSIIAVGKTDRQSRVVIDAGLQRYYAITQAGGGETLKFLQNILVYLSTP